jgi:hypothetical protein
MNLVAVDNVTMNDVQALLEHRAEPCISLYAPMQRAGKETRQNSIRIKNLLRRTTEQLAEQGLTEDAIAGLLEPIHNDIADAPFLQQQNEGLAIFRSADFFAFYRVPLDFDEAVIINHRFHIKPLLPMFTSNGRFYVLALSQNNLRLFCGSRSSLVELALPADMPTSMEAVTQYDDPEKSLQYHTGEGTSLAAPVYHGQADADNRVNLLRYFLEVDRGITQVLHGESAPLVLAGVDYLLPLYHDRNNYPNLLETGVTGNPETLRPDELQPQAWQIVSDYFENARQAALERYGNGLSSDLVSDDLRAIVPAAHYGRVDTLFVADRAEQWGQFNPADGSVTLHETAQPGDTDLLDAAVAQTLLNSGTVYELASADMPNHSLIAAIFRYPA